MTTTNINPTVHLLQQREYFPKNEVLVYGERTWTYQEFVTDVEKLVHALHKRGVGRGDRVAYLGLNSSTFLQTMFASWWLGAIYLPLNFRLAPRELTGLLERADPKVLIVESGHLDVVKDIESKGGLNGPQTFVVDTDELAPLDASVPPYATLLSTLLHEADDTERVPPALGQSDDVAMLMFTSGTTGLPKGVQLTFGNVWWNSINVDSMVDTRRGDTNLAVAPLFHIGGLNALTIRNIVRGGRTVVHRTFDPRKVLSDIEKYQVNQAFMVAAMLSAMHKTDEFTKHDISSLRALICAGAPVPPVLLKQYAVKGIDVQQAWGLTETSPFATYLPAELTRTKPGSCGVPMPYTEIRLVDPVSEEDITKPGDTGEFWVKGPNVSPGYWRDEENTSKSFTEGWFRTGDIGYVDDEGYYYIVDRLKDMVITGGENVYPAEIERVLAEYPGVLDVAVVGVADERWGESVVAVIACESGVRPSIEEIQEFAGEHLARYKLPRRLVLSTELPRNGAGKLDKNAVRNLVAREARHGARA